MDLSLSFARNSDVGLEFLGETFRFREKIGEVILCIASCILKEFDGLVELIQSLSEMVDGS